MQEARRYAVVEGVVKNEAGRNNFLFEYFIYFN